MSTLGFVLSALNLQTDTRADRQLLMLSLRRLHAALLSDKNPIVSAACDAVGLIGERGPLPLPAGDVAAAATAMTGPAATARMLSLHYCDCMRR